MRTKKIIPYTAAHNYIAHIWEYCPSHGINNSWIFFHTQDPLTKANQPNFPKRTTISFSRKTEVLKVLKTEKCVCDYCNWVKLPKQALSNQNRILIYLRFWRSSWWLFAQCPTLIGFPIPAVSNDHYIIELFAMI